MPRAVQRRARRLHRGARSRLRDARRARHRTAPDPARGRFLPLLLRAVPGPLRSLTGYVLRRAPRAWPCARGHAAGHPLHLPDAPRDPARRSARLPALRHGAGAGGTGSRRRPPPRARRRAPPPVLRRTAGARGLRPRDGRASRPARHAMAGAAPVRLAPARAGDAGRSVGRRTLLRARLVLARQSQPQHVDADRARNRRRLRLQRRRGARTGAVPGAAARAERTGAGLLRGGVGHSRPRAGRTGTGAHGTGPHRGCDPRAPRPRTEARPAAARRRRRRGRAARHGPGRGALARQARRERSGGRSRPRRAFLRGREPAERRTGPRGEGGRRRGDGRHPQHVGLLRHARRASGSGHRALAHRRSGREGAAQPRAGPGAGGPGRAPFRAGRGHSGGDRVLRVAGARARAFALLRGGRRSERPHHRLPLRARARHPRCPSWWRPGAAPRGAC